LEYEKEGVREYWIFDPERESTTFYRLQANGRYLAVQPDSDGFYRTPLLPDFGLPVTSLWDEHLPNMHEIFEIMKAMVEKKAD
jgi:Uma2 family endonuclease